MNRNSQPILLTLLSTGVLGMACALAASAQDNDTPTTGATPIVQQKDNLSGVSSDSRTNRKDRRAKRDRDAYDTKSDKDRDRSDNDMDSLMLDPMPVGYPFAAPGSINLYHFRSYRGIDVAPGSATDARYDRDRKLDAMRDRSVRDTDVDEDNIDPMPVGYPFAAPGSINLYHFHTYAGFEIRSGSATDVRDQHERNRDRKRKQQSENANSSSSNP